MFIRWNFTVFNQAHKKPTEKTKISALTVIGLRLLIQIQTVNHKPWLTCSSAHCFATKRNTRYSLSDSTQIMKRFSCLFNVSNLGNVKLSIMYVCTACVFYQKDLCSRRAKRLYLRDILRCTTYNTRKNTIQCLAVWWWCTINSQRCYVYLGYANAIRFFPW